MAAAARSKAEDEKEREMEKAEDEKKREMERREMRREMEKKRKQQEKMERENKRKEEEKIFMESCREQMYCFRCNDRNTGVSDVFVHVDIMWEDFAAQLARRFQRPVYILYRRDGDEHDRAVKGKDDFEDLCAYFDDKQLQTLPVEVRPLEELEEKKRKELQEDKDKIAEHTAHNILLCLQSGKLLEAKKTLCLAIENARLNIAVSQRIAQGFISQEIDNVELNIKWLIIAHGSNDSEIIRIIEVLIPCIAESYVVEALKYCAQQKDYWPILEPLMNRLPNTKIRDLPVLKAIENGDSGTLNLLLQAGACPNYDRGPYDVTPLHVAISKGAAFPQGAVSDRFVFILEMLLRAKAGRNSQKSVDNKNM